MFLSFNQWLDTFLSEKNINLEDSFTVTGPVYGENFMNYQVIVDAIKNTTKEEQSKIKNMLVKIDFNNGDVLHYFRHLGQALAK